MSDCGFCHHPATVHYTRCAVDAGKSTQCRCSQPDFAHEQDATIKALVEALEHAHGHHPGSCEECDKVRIVLKAAKEDAR